MFNFRSLCVVALACGAMHSPAQGVPKLNSASKEWLQRGTTTEVTLNGENLGAAREVIITGDSGVSAFIIPPASPNVQVEASGGGITTVTPQDKNSLRVRMVVTNNASLADRELRVAAAEGISNTLTVRISHLPELVSNESNKSAESAQAVELPAMISGTISGQSEMDHYRFKGKKGEQMLFDLYAFRAGSQLDSSVAVFDKSGRELARSEDVAGLDSVLSFSPPEDGEFTLQVRDYRYAGGGDYRYRIVAGSLPHVGQSFPFGGQRGQTVEVQLKGTNLDGADKMLLHLAGDARLGRQDIRAVTGRGLSNPFAFEVSDLTHTTEIEPNSALDQAEGFSIPGAANGRIQSERDYDAFRFTAAKDQQVVFEAQAFRFGSQLDTLLTLLDSAGNVLQRNDDSAAVDARIDHRFSESGEYYLVIEDLLQRGGDNFGYRLTAVTPGPDFSVQFLPDTPRIRRGGRVPVRIELTRMNGFGEPVRITAEGLPSGLFAEPLVLSPSAGSGLFVVNASSESTPGVFPLKLSATSTLGGKVVVRNVQPSSGDRVVKAGFITVLEGAPFSIAPATLMASIEQNQSGAIEVLVDRRDGFAGDITISPEGFSAGREPITRSFDVQPLTLKSTETRGTITLKTRLDSEIGVRAIILKAEADVNGQKVNDYSALLPVGTAQIPFVLSTTLKRLVVTALPANTQSAASEAFFAVKAERRAGFNGEIELQLEGVPEGIKSSIDKIATGSGEAVIKLLASEKAPVGKEFKLTLTGRGTFNDRNYKFTPEQITLMVNAPEPAETKLAESK